MIPTMCWSQGQSLHILNTLTRLELVVWGLEVKAAITHAC